ncbi:hypothetical protein OPV22_016278 [Ensete ventricosum]|uniref:Uncharacterized protein n=1 Tax=Ensete ventricosum TaxID=4639 RepID=A0AAV8QUS7_ENSVE|nr:hypothetical protein OPV22_016278 [Ensete ventricosum]
MNLVYFPSVVRLRSWQCYPQFLFYAAICPFIFMSSQQKSSLVCLAQQGIQIETDISSDTYTDPLVGNSQRLPLLSFSSCRREFQLFSPDVFS